LLISLIKGHAAVGTVLGLVDVFLFFIVFVLRLVVLSVSV
jgi:hypothetical protein